MTKQKSLYRRTPLHKKVLVVVPALVLAFSGLTPAAGITHAAVPKTPDSIRVALYLESSKYKLTEPTVALSSGAGLAISRRGSAAPGAWLTADGSGPVRFGFDAYKLALKPIEDLAAAKTTAQQLTAAGYPAEVYKVSLSGKTVFRVEAGTYVTAAASASAFAELSKNPVFAALLPNVEQAGPLRLTAGTFATEAEAATKRSPLEAAGIKTEMVLLENPAGGAAYAVWVGGEAAAEQLAAVKQQAETAVPGLALQPVDPVVPYFLKRDNVTAAETAAAAAGVHYLFNLNGQKVWVAPKQGEITVKEKGNRTYRGGIELSQFNGKMAVINELPFEQYLYSVVDAEMGTGWPQEALKAQAVAARTYAVQAGTKYEIANVTDTVADQAYYGNESADVTKAVEATKGELLAVGQSLATPFYSANAGGLSADSAEVWGSNFSHLKSVESADEGAAKGKAAWLQIVTTNGSPGFVPAAQMRDTGGKNTVGLPLFEAVKAGVQIRNEPSPEKDTASNPVLGELNVGERAVSLGQAVENNSFSWREGPIDAAALAAAMNKVLASPIAGPLSTLEIASKGPSGRVTKVKANGQDVKVSSPDAYRSVLGGLRSTLFDIEETGRYTVMGADGVKREYPQSGPAAYSVQSAAAAPAALGQNLIIMNADNKVRLATKEAKFVFTGKGWGHGIGMSQWGARGYAEQGYDYRWILAHYYTGASVVKE